MVVSKNDDVLSKLNQKEMILQWDNTGKVGITRKKVFHPNCSTSIEKLFTLWRVSA